MKTIEKIVDGRIKNHLKNRNLIAKNEKKQEVKERSKVRKAFRTKFAAMFPELRRLTKIRFNHLQPQHAFFEFKGQPYSVALVDSVSEAAPGSAEGDMDMTWWELHSWSYIPTGQDTFGAWSKSIAGIVQDYDVKKGEDYTKNILWELEKLERQRQIKRPD